MNKNMYLQNMYKQLNLNKMKKSILAAVVLGGLISSCSKNGEKAITEDAREVSVVKTDDTKTFDRVKEESFVDWRASHLGGVQHRYGKIKLKSAEFLVNNDALSNATVVMDMTSFTIENFPEGDEKITKLTGHLQSADFFDIELFPIATFELINVKNTSGDFSSLVTGNLTIMDVTKSISFRANISISDAQVSIASEDFAVNRTDWNLTYNTEGTAGISADYLISNDIGFTINVSLSKSS